MKGYLKWKYKSGKKFKTTKEITVAEARKYYIEKFKDNPDVVSVYMIKFGTWHWEVCKVFKKEV